MHRLDLVIDLTLLSFEARCILDAQLKGDSIPIVLVSALQKVMKKHLSAYLIFVKDKVFDDSEGNLSKVDKDRIEFLLQYKDCFSKSLPRELALVRPKVHGIDIILGSSPPNKAPYRVSRAP